MRFTNTAAMLATLSLFGGLLALPAYADDATGNPDGRIERDVIDDDVDVDKIEVEVEGRSPKQLNDPLPPAVMQERTVPGPATTPPRGVPQGMGNETHSTKTPGDDDPSDGVDEPGRNPVPGLPRPGPDAVD
ncbi:MAG: hypothetical protein ABR587_03115 [Candidatus Binatia bacterium]